MIGKKVPFSPGIPRRHGMPLAFNKFDRHFLLERCQRGLFFGNF
jgi:hypothetical protein